MRPRVLISACLLGVHCRWDGTGRVLPEWEELLALCEPLPLCPEQLGGLPTPRVPAERAGSRIRMRDGGDGTAAFLRGAQETLVLAQRLGVRLALLKERSPSCGSGSVYDGSFRGVLVDGDGVTARLLKQHGIAVYGESRVGELMDLLRREVTV